MCLLKIENMYKKYKQNWVLENINFNIKQGEFVAIIGASGSGKSTLMNVIAGLDNVNKGSIKIKGKEITKLTNNEKTIFRRKNIGYIYQFYNLIPTLSVKENIILPIVLDEKKVNYERFYSLVKELKLENLLNRLPNELSGGQQQKVAIARALVTNPSIIIADEPTGNLDTKEALKIIKKIKYYNTKLNQTILLVTHDMRIAKMAKRIIEIKDGKIIKDKINE